MPTFTLRYDDDGLGLDKRVEFDGTTPAIALNLASGEAAGRRAVLLADGKPLCRLGREVDGFWIVAQPNCPGSPA
jgi:hypothetical protein